MRWSFKQDRLTSLPWLAEVTALLGGLWYLVQSWGYAHTQASVIDEGLYLYKGYLFVSGRYWPFQDFGPWTNHMPLSFLIPGYVQRLFGFGIRTGRYFSIVLGVSMLLGLWVVTRRLGGRWWGAIAIWAVALNPMFSKLYSVAIPQVLIACLLMWMLVLTLGEARPSWQLILGSVIAGIMLLTRINLAPILPILLIYIWWQHGFKACIPAAIAGILTVAIGHMLFWPDILKLWAAWLPPSLTPFLDPWRVMGGGELFWNPDFAFQSRIESLIGGIRLYFIPVVAVLSVWLLWPSRKNWKSETSFKLGVFMSVLYGTLFFLHAWASIGLDYCISCFRRYLAFFSPLGVVLFINTFDMRKIKIPRVRQGVIVSTIMILYVLYMQSYYYHDMIIGIVNDVLSIEVPRIRSFRILSGTTELWGLLINKFDLSMDALNSIGVQVVIFIAGITFLAVIYLCKCIASRIDTRLDRPFAYMVLMAILVMGMLLTPTKALGAGYDAYDCSGDVIASYEQVGQSLAATIPAGAKIYWEGGPSPTPLLYLPEAMIFPAQLNGDYTFRIGGDRDLLSKYGLWNQDLAEQWWIESDYLLIEERVYNEWVSESQELKSGEMFYIDLVRSTIASGEFLELKSTDPALPCRPDSKILIFRRES